LFRSLDFAAYVLWLLPGDKGSTPFRQSTIADHQVRAERPVFAMDCGWAPALEQLGTELAPLWEVREWRAGGCPQLDLHNASVP